MLGVHSHPPPLPSLPPPLIPTGSLVDFAVDAQSPRRIDGIVLTKFDTIDDKVGAALSMVYMTGIPIAFLGTGQHYPDLKRLNVGSVVKSLLS